jgi:HSF-type DNA-binding
MIAQQHQDNYKTGGRGDGKVVKNENISIELVDLCLKALKTIEGRTSSSSDSPTSNIVEIPRLPQQEQRRGSVATSRSQVKPYDARRYISTTSPNLAQGNRTLAITQAHERMIAFQTRKVRQHLAAQAHRRRAILSTPRWPNLGQQFLLSAARQQLLLAALPSSPTSAAFPHEANEHLLISTLPPHDHQKPNEDAAQCPPGAALAVGKAHLLMASSADAAGKETASCEEISFSVREQKQSFPLKLYKMLQDAEKEGNEDVISFQPDGRIFSIHDKPRFLSEITPRYFVSTRYASFKRQLNLYGFTYTVVDAKYAPSFFHPSFVKGRPILLSGIHRKKQQPYSPPATTIGRLAVVGPMIASAGIKNNDHVCAAGGRGPPNSQPMDDNSDDNGEGEEDEQQARKVLVLMMKNRSKTIPTGGASCVNTDQGPPRTVFV